MDGVILPFEDIKRGREISIYLPEGRWEMAVTGADEAMIAETEFEAFELEVTDEDLPAEVDIAPPPVVEETAEQSAPASDGTTMWYWWLLAGAAVVIVWMLRKKRRERREG
jgi:hypothetical protein